MVEAFALAALTVKIMYVCVTLQKPFLVLPLEATGAEGNFPALFPIPPSYSLPLATTASFFLPFKLRMLFIFPSSFYIFPTICWSQNKPRSRLDHSAPFKR